MAIRSIVTRGYGSGATIPLIVLRGYSLPVDPNGPIWQTNFWSSDLWADKLWRGLDASIPILPSTELRTHIIDFTSLSRGMTFSAVQRSMEFTSASRSVTIQDKGEATTIIRILNEDGSFILMESGNKVRRE